MVSCRKMFVCSLLAAFSLGLISSATAEIITYTDESAFLSAIESGYYLEDFNQYSDWSRVSNPSSFSENGYSYTMYEHGSSFYAVPGIFYDDNGFPDDESMWDEGTAISTNGYGETIFVEYTGTSVTAVGGYFYVTDYNANLLTNWTARVSVTDAEGTTSYLVDCSGGSATFLGFTSSSSISLISIDPNTQSGSNNYATMEHLYTGTAAVPEPSTLLLSLVGLVGLAIFAWRKTK